MYSLSSLFLATLALASTVHAFPDRVMFNQVLLAHGILAGLAWALLMPLGAIGIRFMRGKNAIWIHAWWMVFCYVIVLAALGMGIWIAVVTEKIRTAHAIIGLIVVGALLLQPLTGLIHHAVFKKLGRPSPSTHIHVWWGRIILTLGIINGGLGLQLVKATGYYPDIYKGEIAYGVVAGVVWLVWVAVIAVSFIKSRDEEQGETGEKANIGTGSNERIHQHESTSNSEYASGRPSDSHRPSVASPDVKPGVMV